MPVTIGNTFTLSSSPLIKIEEEALATQNQGIVSILKTDSTQPKAASLRRTFSADMSPAKLLSQNGFSYGLPSTFTPLKKSEEVPIFEEEKEEERPDQDDVWRLIQSQKKKDNQKQEEGQVDVWGSILAQKDKEDISKSSSPPYVPSVMKRSTSCPLNEKSLEICTESLGSETGSDVFSSRAPSETGDAEEETETHDNVPKQNLSTNKKPPTRSFPPPLPSLPRPDAPSLFMKPHRENGRLVLQAVSVPSQNRFHAARQDGRLLLTFADDSNPKRADDNHDQFLGDFELEADDPTTEKESDEDEDEEDADGEKECVIAVEQVPEKYSSHDVTNDNRTVMKKLMRLDNRKPKRNTTQNMNISFNCKGVKQAEGEEEEEIHHPIPQSLPRPPPVGRLIPSPPPNAAVSFNAYDYFWRAKSTTATAANSANIKDYPIFKKNSHNSQLPLSLRENREDYLLPLFKGCKEEPRRSHLAREPHCIATS